MYSDCFFMASKTPISNSLSICHSQSDLVDPCEKTNEFFLQLPPWNTFWNNIAKHRCTTDVRTTHRLYLETKLNYFAVASQLGVPRSRPYQLRSRVDGSCSPCLMSILWQPSHHQFYTHLVTTKSDLSFLDSYIKHYQLLIWAYGTVQV